MLATLILVGKAALVCTAVYVIGKSIHDLLQRITEALLDLVLPTSRRCQKTKSFISSCSPGFVFSRPPNASRRPWAPGQPLDGHPQRLGQIHPAVQVFFLFNFVLGREDGP